MLSKANYQALGINLLTDKEGESERAEEQNNVKTSTQRIQMKYLVSHWYKHLIHYLLFLNCLVNFDKVNTWF